MAAIQPYPDKAVLFKDKLMTRVVQTRGQIDYTIYAIEIADFDSDGQQEILFSLVAGFSQQPRGLYIYDPQDDTLIKTPFLGAYLSVPQIVDLDNNSIPEILCGSSSMGNIHDSLGIPYSDYSSWFFYFDHNLQMKIPPIENSPYPSGTRVIEYANEENEKFIAILNLDQAASIQELIFYLPDGTEFSTTSFQCPANKRNNTVMKSCTL